MTAHNQSTRATVDVINFWCVAILIISAASVAGVVGAAVAAGEFEDRGLDLEDEATQTDVLTETNPDGTTRIRWAENGHAEYLEVRANGEVTRLDFIGDETTIDGGTFEVVAINQDGSEDVVTSSG